MNDKGLLNNQTFPSQSLRQTLLHQTSQMELGLIHK